MSTKRYNDYEGSVEKPQNKGRLRTLLESTAFLVICIVVALVALAVLWLYPDLLAGIFLIIFVAIAVVAVLAVVVSVIMSIVAVPLYLAKGQHLDNLDYDINDVKERNDPEDKG